MPATSSIDVLLFDLGGVLVEFTGLRDLAALLPSQLSETEIAKRWAACPHSLAFGTGALSADAFADAFVRDWQIALEPEAFLDDYRFWSRGLLPGAADLLDTLRGRYRLAALSNSNPVHWDRQTHDLGITALFDAAISSHQVGLRKPDPAIYIRALELLDVSADRVLFFDDAQGNVDSARSVGMHAARVDGAGGVRDQLERHGLL